MQNTQKFAVRGMGCAACVASVEKHTRALNGVTKSDVNLLTNSMIVTYDSTLCNADKIIKAVEDAGFEAEVVKESDEDGDPKADRRQQEHRLRLIFSVIFWLPLMFLAMYPMMGAILPSYVMDFMDSYFKGTENAYVYAFLQFLLLVPIVLLNFSYYTKGIKAIFRGRPNMDTLIAIGSLAAIGYGIYFIVRMATGVAMGNHVMAEHGRHDLYFETAGTILTLITVGKYLESVSKGKTKEALKKLMSLSPQTALLLIDNEEVTVPTEQVKEGDIFILKPGMRVPADGVVLEGHSSIDESAITGESMPVAKEEESIVITATVNNEGILRCRAEKVGKDTTLSRIINLVEEAGMRKAPIASLADKVAGIFVPIVILIAIGSMIIWLIAGAEFEFAMSMAISVLVISCPCALGLATPVAIMVGTGIGAGMGILIKSGESLQAAGEVDTVVFDKTGTLTKGEPQVKEVSVWKEEYSKTDLIQLCAQLEAGSEHPLAKAVIAKAELLNSKKTAMEKEIVNSKVIKEITDFKAIPGKGITAILDKKNYLVGNIKLMNEKQIFPTEEQKMRIHAAEEKALTPLLIAENGELIGMFAIADTLKETAKEAVELLIKEGIEPVMLTGDTQSVAKRIGEEAGISKIYSEVLPWQKEECIRELSEKKSGVAMVGDGINDAPSLVAANVGIALGAGTDIAMESADIVLMNSDPLDVGRTIKLSRLVMRNIKQNLFWAFFYNLIGIPLAAGALYPFFHIRMNPMFGAAAMSLSSLFVVGNALRLKLIRIK